MDPSATFFPALPALSPLIQQGAGRGKRRPCVRGHRRRRWPTLTPATSLRPRRVVFVVSIPVDGSGKRVLTAVRRSMPLSTGRADGPWQAPGLC